MTKSGFSLSKFAINPPFLGGFLLTILMLSARTLPAAEPGNQKGDIFADIGSRAADDLTKGLVEIQPPKLTPRLLPLDADPANGSFQPAPKITTATELDEELACQRLAFAPYLRDLAPSIEKTRIRVPLESFAWRIQTAADREDFSRVLTGGGDWTRVTIPHYGGPMGLAVTYYRTEFTVTPEMLRAGALFVHFKGVDYKAAVYVNGSWLGSHEGYFAPFEFDFTPQAHLGKNVLVVQVMNDFSMLGNDVTLGYIGGRRQVGDKIFACGGPCWDDPMAGWHNCPPGMGIWQDVAIEARPRLFLNDLFVRPLQGSGKVEAWVEVSDCDSESRNVTLQLSVFGQNFPATAVAKQVFAGQLAGHGVACFKIPLAIPQPRLWEPAAPWLYQLQVSLLDAQGRLLDMSKQQFGLRTFRMDYAGEPKGRMFLNDQPIRLRGANTMGAFEQCVIRKDWSQLINDILLARITHLNYIRLTQTPVQEEIYDYCDRLGLMLQTDLPLFGQLSRTQFPEAVRQAGEMERLVRSHPSNILVTFINEPFPNANKASQRNVSRPELNRFFDAADSIVHLANPDRVTKAVDGDYDPPGPGLPDNHCYTLWYNGHAIDAGKLYKGYWVRVKPGWLFGCGEFGSEGLDPVSLMRRRYPKDWLPQTAEEEKQWTPAKIPGSQTAAHGGYFFDTPHTLSGWVQSSQQYQEWATRLMTESFRRNAGMQSFAIHLFIDAFPDGWMKALMDCERRPKPAWFAYRDALTPLVVNLRGDRHAFYSGEKMNVEAWVCNDLPDVPAGASLRYQLLLDGTALQGGSVAAHIESVAPTYQGTLPFIAPKVSSRGSITIRLGLVDATGKVLHDTSATYDVFSSQAPKSLPPLYIIGKPDGTAARLAADLGCQPLFSGKIDPAYTILIDDPQAFENVRNSVTEAVRAGARAVFLELPKGALRIGETDVVVGQGNTRGYYFVSRNTGHPLVNGFQPQDFKFWYDASLDRPSPLITAGIFSAPGWKPILLSGPDFAAASQDEGKGDWLICQIHLAGRIAGNPVAEIFARRLLEKKCGP